MVDTVLNLVFSCWCSCNGSAYEPFAYWYDLNNNRSVYDYAVDGTSGTDKKREKLYLVSILLSKRRCYKWKL
jgi:hypothetical protein